MVYKEHSVQTRAVKSIRTLAVLKTGWSFVKYNLLTKFNRTTEAKQRSILQHSILSPAQ